MTFKTYLELFNSTDLNYPENRQAFIPINHYRMNRWLKKGQIDPEMKDRLERVKEKLRWVLITEPWCGDAAQASPFIYLMSKINSKFTLEIQLRDTDSEIDKYPTNGNLSIPKLIIRNDENKDVFIWGARPKTLEDYRKSLIASGIDTQELKIKEQQWYNEDKGESIVKEILKGILSGL